MVIYLHHECSLERHPCQGSTEHVVRLPGSIWCRSKCRTLVDYVRVTVDGDAWLLARMRARGKSLRLDSPN